MSYISKKIQTALDEQTPIAMLTCRRGRYDEIESMNGPGALSSAKVIVMFKPALPDLGIEGFPLSGRAKRTHGPRGWRSISASLYGYDPLQGVAVIQLRQSETGRYGIDRKKTYVLCGTNEITAEMFRHPVSSAAVRGAVRSDYGDPVHVVRRVQAWMWGCTGKQLREALAAGGRQGDVLLVRIAGEPAGRKMAERAIIIGESHEVRANELREDGDERVFALNPSLVHTKEQHAPAFADEEGWYSVRLARTAPAWSFGDRIGD